MSPERRETLDFLEWAGDFLGRIEWGLLMHDRAAGYLSVTSAFHARRIRETIEYERYLDEIVISRLKPAHKDEISHSRLLKQPFAYQVLAVIWKNSPFSAGLSGWEGFESHLTINSLANSLSPSKEQRSKTANYIMRVVEAAEHFDLATRMDASLNRRPIMGTQLLHDFMCGYAQSCLKMND